MLVRRTVRMVAHTVRLAAHRQMRDNPHTVTAVRLALMGQRVRLAQWVLQVRLVRLARRVTPSTALQT
jgi:hypothetical protein